MLPHSLVLLVQKAVLNFDVRAVKRLPAVAGQQEVNNRWAKAEDQNASDANWDEQPAVDTRVALLLHVTCPVAICPGGLCLNGTTPITPYVYCQ